MFFINWLQDVGKVAVFTVRMFASLFRVYIYFKECLVQLCNIGYFSIIIVALTSLFTGAVLAMQSYNALANFNIESIIAKIVVISIVREIGPVLVGLVVTGRIAGSIAAELGSMNVTEQIDTIKSLSIDPFVYLLAPRVIASIISFPLLLLIADVIGVYSGYLISIYKFDLNSFLYIKYTFKFLSYKDVCTGLLKSILFGVFATIISCYHGYYCYGGARSVGYAATRSVVDAFISILILNYIITNIFFNN